MAHFAEISEDGIVLRVLVTDNSLPNEGKDWLEDNLGGTWVQTSYNTLAGIHSQGEVPFRMNYAGIGFTYNPDRDAFIPPQPYPSWSLDETTCTWEAPYPMPDHPATWDENLQQWVALD
jgi:hypothetical protein